MPGDKYESIFILLHADIQLDQHHLLKMLSFFHCMVLDSLSKIECPEVCEFILYGFMLKSFIHFDLKIVQGDKNGSVFFFSACRHQLSQYHLLKMFSFVHCMVLSSMSNSRVHKCVGLFWGLQFYFIDQHICF